MRLTPYYSLLLFVLFLVLLAHQFLDGSQFDMHAANTHHHECQKGEQPDPGDDIGGDQVIESLHVIYPFFLARETRAGLPPVLVTPQQSGFPPNWRADAAPTSACAATGRVGS